MRINTQDAALRGTTGALLLLSGLGGLLFIAVFVVLGVSVPGYSPLRDAISALELTHMGWVQQANFFGFGLLLCAFGVALRRELASGFGSTLIPLFQWVAGLAVIGDAVLIHPPLHLTCDIVAFNAAMCVLLLFAWRLRGDKRWRGWTTYSVATAVAMMALLFLFGWLNVHGGPAGLMEKLATAVRTLWSLLLVARLVAGVSLAPETPAARL